MREIGSEFWDVPTVNGGNEVFQNSTQWYLSGRSALQAIIRSLRDCRTVSLPSWCCDSMVKPFVNAGIDVCFYPVYWKDGLGLIQEISLESDALLLMDYFGYTSDVPELREYQGVVIRDVTHSIFSSTYADADFYFGSLRKWCGVWTGGYAWTKEDQKLSVEQEDDNGYVAYREKAMLQKSEYINGFRFDKEYLKEFEKAEETLENVSIVPACKRDVELVKKLDVEFIRQRRKENAEALRAVFPDILIFTEMKKSDCPLFVPVLIPDGKRDDLRRFLINNDIYCPVHWPVSTYHKLDGITEKIYKNELSLVCDQRYTKEDMYRMADVIQKFWKEV